MNCLRTNHNRNKAACQPELRIVSSRKIGSRRKPRKGSYLKAAENVMFAVAAAGVLWVATAGVIETIKTNIFAPIQSTTTIKVLPGETLWQIASRVGQGDEGQSEAANEIRSLNPSLKANPVLSAGQTIIVPAQTYSDQLSDLHLAKAKDTPNRSM